MKAYNRQLSLYSDVHENNPDDTILYESIDPLTDQTMIWLIEWNFTKRRRDKFILHDISHIL